MKQTSYIVYFGDRLVELKALNREQAIIKAMKFRIDKGMGYSVSGIKSEYDLKPQSVSVSIEFNNKNNNHDNRND